MKAYYLLSLVFSVRYDEHDPWPANPLVDSNQNHREEEPGPKQIITYTIYLNDDYEGGEIDFVDEENKKVFVYKPKKGDITVFPSGRPFWHGARSVKSQPNKIFIRSFSIFCSFWT